ncbi:MAG: TldD/PmbA family protein [Bacillota bacterium]|nr:TldD/PmbA family protein [Bacillota bacterium]
MVLNMPDLEAVLAEARAKGAGYADVRYSERLMEGLSVRNGVVEEMASTGDRGVGVRALFDGAWGFASTDDLSRESLLAAAERAVGIARASARWKHGEGVTLAPEPVHVDTWRNPVARDPFAVTPEKRIELLADACARMRSAPRVTLAQAQVAMWRERKLFASTEGSRIQQEITECGAGLTALARGPSDTQRRSFSDFGTGGYEFVENLDLPARAAQLGREADALLDAETCPRGPADLVLGADMIALQIHESCGHPIELDRVLGSEATFAGTSFLTLDRRGSFRYGSPAVNITADATVPGGLGTFGYDDDGVAAQPTVIMDQGIFKNYLTSRETAARFGERSGGTARAVGWMNIPLIRMTNVNLMPGDWGLEEIIRDTKRGIFLDTPKSWSLDDKRVNFHFGCEIGYEIVDGALGAMLKNGAYTALTPDFWGACDAVGNRTHWRVHGTPGCAKGEPVQVVHCGHGAAPARFRGIRAGVGA